MKPYTEAEEQAAVMRWAFFESAYMPELKLLFHIPNGGSRNKLEAVHLKQQGVKSGVPDLMLPVARRGYHGLFIEMKRTKGARVSDEQKDWLGRLLREGYLALVCHGFEEARTALTDYIRMEEKK